MTTKNEDAAKVLNELLRRFEATIPTPSNRRGESTMRIEHFIGLVHEAKQAIAFLTQQREAGAVAEWRWVDERGRPMTKWAAGDPPPMDSVSDEKGTMRVEIRPAQAASQEGERWLREKADEMRMADADKASVEELCQYLNSFVRGQAAHPAADKVLVTDAMVGRMFAKARGYDCFFMFDNETLRRCVAQWLAAALSPPANGENDENC